MHIFGVDHSRPVLLICFDVIPHTTSKQKGAQALCDYGQVKYWQLHAATDPPWLPSTDTNRLPPAATLAALPLDDPRISTGKGFTVIDHCVTWASKPQLGRMARVLYTLGLQVPSEKAFGVGLVQIKNTF